MAYITAVQYTELPDAENHRWAGSGRGHAANNVSCYCKPYDGGSHLNALKDHESHDTLEKVHQLYAVETNTVKEEHWKEFLEAAMECELWIANKYITNPSSDEEKTRIPTLRYTALDGLPAEAVTNKEKGELFT
ncbi:hypothetical protein Hypma_010538 [Hypsizygus marmoreus]|uniref:Uncharacterized protein n=1 Tax=Hypsizygus marmoreus TaxID=39966 RepID=A0A369JKE4_HYPMA|nr:hypothetical protein Hypma_010538 [Hypsizygus marmoreus]